MSEDEIGYCADCGKRVDDLNDVGYLGPVDRESECCSPFIPFELVCTDCEELQG